MINKLILLEMSFFDFFHKRKNIKFFKKNSFGLYNVSVGKKVYLSKIITWLNFYNPNTISFIKPKNSFNEECFTLNNNKLMQKIRIKNNLQELKNE